jgi:hypothetical protein
MAPSKQVPRSPIFVPEVDSWYRALSSDDANRVAAALDELEQVGSTLGRPYVDRIKGSRYHNMKELRPHGGNIRVLFAFDPHRNPVLLVGGDKTNNWKGWYDQNIPLADERYARHLRSLGKEGAWPIQTQRAGRRSAGRDR